MNVDLIKAMIARKAQAEKDRFELLQRDPALHHASQQHRAVYNAMRTLLGQIEQGQASELDPASTGGRQL